jgi:peroxiredoxin
VAAIKPRTNVPELEVPTLRHGTWRLGVSTPRMLQMIVFYRGVHCPLCKRQIPELDRNVENFASRGVDVIAISSDPQERALQAQEAWGIQRLPIGYALPIAVAREWGLFISAARTDNEPAQFCEPGIFLVEPQGTLYGSIVSSMPFARPSLSDIIAAVDFIAKVGYQARGEI